MPSSIPILFIKLKGPLQSWGERAKWNQRETAFMPTKSAIVGIIACAIGLPRNDARITALSKSIQIAIRADRAGDLMTDYHTITGLIRTAEGNQRGKKGEDSTIISRRQYLQDASFLVAISADEGILKECSQALEKPVWVPYLGRKSCVPTVPLIAEINDKYNSLDDAMQNYPLDIAAGYQTGNIVYEIDADTGGYLRSDEVTAMPGRLYNHRRVVLKSI